MKLLDGDIYFKKFVYSILLIGLVYPVIGDVYNTSNFETFSGPEWRNCGIGNNWHPDTSKDHLNVLKSGPIECTGVSSICRDVDGPANITFYWKSDAINKDFGQLLFSVDDTKYVCHSDNWAPMSYLIWGDGHHELKWEFRKIKCYPKNKGTGWIADVSIETNEPNRNGYPSQTPFSNTTMMASNIAMLPSGTFIVASNVTISPNNITINPSQLTISPTNLASIPDIRVSIIPPNECPTVELTRPVDNSSVLVDNQVQFLYRPADDMALINCSLYIMNYNGTFDVINSSKIYADDINVLNYSFDEIGEHRWCIKCCDDVECSESKHNYRNISVFPKTVYVDQKLLMPDGITYFNSISEAIKNVPGGTTIIVEQGDYMENDLVIDKSIILKGNRSVLNKKPHISGGGPVILIKSSDVVIDGFNITKIDGGGEGIRVKNNKQYYYKNIKIMNNSIHPHCIVGIFLDKCMNCYVSNNSINETYEASILLTNCINSSLFDNTIDNKYFDSGEGTLKCCLELLDSRDIMISNNTLRKSPIGIWCYNSTIINNSITLECKCRLNESTIWEFIKNSNYVENISEHCRVYQDVSKLL